VTLISRLLNCFCVYLKVSNFAFAMYLVQVCLEGEISKQSALRSLSEGNLPNGDMIPWTISQQFQDAEFPSLSGARIVRIAVHPNLIRVIVALNLKFLTLTIGVKSDRRMI
jgi:tRNA(Met) C34 N-acetyltransferase TmcA